MFDTFGASFGAFVKAIGFGGAGRGFDSYMYTHNICVNYR